MYTTKYVPGTYNAICDRCGYKYKANKLRLTWDNLFVCESCWEPRHPQDFVRAKIDNQSVPIPRPEPAETYTANFSTKLSSVEMLIYGAEADCDVGIIQVYVRGEWHSVMGDFITWDNEDYFIGGAVGGCDAPASIGGEAWRWYTNGLDAKGKLVSVYGEAWEGLEQPEAIRLRMTRTVTSITVTVKGDYGTVLGATSNYESLASLPLSGYGNS